MGAEDARGIQQFIQIMKKNPPWSSGEGYKPEYVGYSQMMDARDELSKFLAETELPDDEEIFRLFGAAYPKKLDIQR